MIKNPTPLAIAAAIFVLSGIFLGLSPVSASNASYGTSGYLPDQVQNQAKDVEPMINTYGDTGLPESFPVEKQGSLEDAAPQMYN
jgi:hypothetical protein